LLDIKSNRNRPEGLTTMKTLSAIYADAVKVLQPSRAEMERREAPFRLAYAEARVSVINDLLSGANVRDLYDAEKGAIERNRAVVLLGVLRRDFTALNIRAGEMFTYYTWGIGKSCAVERASRDGKIIHFVGGAWRVIDTTNAIEGIES
jgi:hypothetical protein